MKKVGPVIDSIRDAYKRDQLSVISESELLSYIQSVDFLENLLRFSQTVVTLIEYNTWSYLYVSSNCFEVLGHTAEECLTEGPRFGLSCFHPDDIPVQSGLHPGMVNHLKTVSAEERNRYKYSFTSRLIRKDGKVIQVLQNNFFLKWDEQGQPLIKLFTLTDITSYKNNNDIVFYITHHKRNGENQVELQQNFSTNKNIALSAREMEVIALTASGLSAKEISDKIHVAEETVKRHKKTITEKLQCSNSAQAVALASLYGLITHPNNGIGVLS